MDLSAEKLRPALVLVGEDKYKDLILAFIGSESNKKTGSDILVSEKSKDFSQTGLKVSSIIRLNKVVTLSRDIVEGKIGRLSKKHLKRVDQRLREIFDL